MEFPRIRFFFSIIIYGLHGINEKPSPVWTIYCVPLFFFYRISPCLICYLTTTKWVLYVALYLLYNGVPSLQRCTLYEEYVIFALYNFVQCSFLLTKYHASYYQRLLRICYVLYLYSLKFFLTVFPRQSIYLYNQKYVHCKISEFFMYI